MPQAATKYFGELPYGEDTTFEFAAGIPGFEEHTRFLFLDFPQLRPLVFMQSLRDPALCFMALPVRVADPRYELKLSPDDEDTLGLAPGGAVRIGREVVALALVSTAEGREPTVNLMSPIVLHLARRRGLQAIQSGSGYPLRQALVLEQELAPCL